MPDIFDYPILPEMPFLEELAEDLEDTFHVIAHAEHYKNLTYIREIQEYFRNRYGRFIKHVNSQVGQFHIIPAYDLLQELLDNNPTPAQIKRDCEECLDEHLIGAEPSEDHIRAFQEFYAGI
jgi:hypothetical protein